MDIIELQKRFIAVVEDDMSDEEFCSVASQDYVVIDVAHYKIIMRADGLSLAEEEDMIESEIRALNWDDAVTMMRLKGDDGLLGRRVYYATKQVKNI